MKATKAQLFNKQSARIRKTIPAKLYAELLKIAEKAIQEGSTMAAITKQIFDPKIWTAVGKLAVKDGFEIIDNQYHFHITWKDSQ